MSAIFASPFRTLLPMAVLGSIGIIAALSPAQAQVGETRRTVEVSAKDLNSPAGVAKLDQRLRHAARVACRAPQDYRDVKEARRGDLCETAALSAAQPHRNQMVAMATMRSVTTAQAEVPE